MAFWQMWLYIAMVPLTGAAIAWIAYDTGRAKGREMERMRHDDTKVIVPRAFTQANPTKESGRRARSGKARIIPRKQITPGPRREKPKKEQ